MRFIAEGPSIPEELLLARDQGRVIFFCGAGVSIAKAKLPDFFKLAVSVGDQLGVQEDSAAAKLITAFQENAKKTEQIALIPADKIFGLLERDFFTEDIYEAVANILTPSDDVDLSAHNIMLKLATAPNGIVRLVTTNFDRLFDKCNPQLQTFIPPNLPNFSSLSSFEGIVYLHGKVNEEGTGAEGERFVLSSSEFGEAYLADGWATSFIKGMIEKYVVVFVGYSADDPPIQYILEALGKSPSIPNKLYAFQLGDANEASIKWRHKGVTAIPFDQFEFMWKTLELWSIEAESPNEWCRSVLVRTGQKPPHELKPFERAQVAYIVSHLEGMRELEKLSFSLPASWIYVFDSSLRHKRDELGYFLYSLDSDPIPSQGPKPSYAYANEDASMAWDAFAINDHDLLCAAGASLEKLLGGIARASHNTILPLRLRLLTYWLKNVMEFPEIFFWAASQKNLHPTFKKILKEELFSRSNFNSVMRTAWLYLLDFFDHKICEDDTLWAWEKEQSMTGLTDRLLRCFYERAKPYISVRPCLFRDDIVVDENLHLNKLVHLEIKYPRIPNRIQVADDKLYEFVHVIRRNLEFAVGLEQEIKPFFLNFRIAIASKSKREGERTKLEGLLFWVFFYITYLERLSDVSIEKAQQEVSLWPKDGDYVFAWFRIWALGKDNLIPPHDIRFLFNMIPQDAFWESYYKRDLLLAISSRWGEYDFEAKQYLKERFLEGPPKYQNRDNEQDEERKAREILERLEWLKSQGCDFEIEETLYKFLCQRVRNWDPSFANDAVAYMGGCCGIVTKDEDYTSLMGVPLKDVLDKSEEISRKNCGITFVEKVPYEGLLRKKPVRAFLALHQSLKTSNMREWAWNAFLESDCRQEDKPRLIKHIAVVLLQVPDEKLAKILYSVCLWLKRLSPFLYEHYCSIINALITKVIRCIKEYSEESVSVIRTEDKDWLFDAINSLFDALLKTLLNEPSIATRKDGSGLPSEVQTSIECLLDMPSPLRQYTLSLLGFNLSYFFEIDREWSKTYILSSLEVDKDQDALWSGILKSKITREVFFAIKPYLIKRCHRKKYISKPNNNWRNLAGLVFLAWELPSHDTGERWISDSDLKKIILNSNDDFRCSLLNHIKKKDDGDMISDLKTLLANAWPKQSNILSPNISVCLCDIAIQAKTFFADVVDLILPKLTKFNPENFLLFSVEEDLIKTHPEKFLSMLHKVLPDDANRWPNIIHDYLEQLRDAKPELAKDDRFIELHGKGNTYLL